MCAPALSTAGSLGYIGAQLPAWGIADSAHAWVLSNLHLPVATLAFLRRLLDSLDLFSKVPVNPEAWYLVGVQVLGAPGFDFLSPIGTSGVTIAAAMNPCIGGYADRCPGALSSSSNRRRQAPGG